ncbi:MAG: hypothetical protein LBG98_00560 [Puniceicoccales bacterium]|nr:hypothetical protein [Puniceicoccales bacterium]
MWNAETCLLCVLFFIPSFFPLFSLLSTFFDDTLYDSDDIILSLSSRGIVPTIPLKINRKSHRSYDKNIYKKRHIIENTFLKMKEWRSISTRYFKNIHSFVSVFYIRSISLFAA